MLKTLVLPITLLAILAFSCKSTAPVIEEAAEVEMKKVPQDEKSLLWEISGNSLATNSFLFGTIHMIAGEDYFLPQGTLSAVDVSDKMIFEIDMADMSDPMKLMPLMQKAFMKGDTTLKDLVTAEEYTMIETRFNEMGLPIFFLERIKPMFLTVFATSDFDPNGLQNGSLKSYEMEFAKMAADGGKETGGLETVEYQISVFDEIPYKDQANMLVESLNSSDTDNDVFKELIALYLDQDISGLYELMKEDESIEEYEDALLNTRNLNWIPIMQKEMEAQRTFFAVGAGHLGGHQGVINLLREAGYTVTPYKG